ncbi:MAG: ABC transporter permease [Chloroflexi bacterium]|nr:ABC transporter permease [Chloroflexota bacterium]
MSRPLLLSLRNTFRRKGRLALTLATLTLGGAIFIGVFSVRASMLRAMDDLMQLYQFDVWVVATRPHRVDQLEREALRVQGVTSASTWLQMPVRRVRPDENESGTIYLFALKPESNLLKPVIVRGRWLLPDDGNAIVVNTNFLKDEPDVDVGSDIVLKVEGRETTWRIVGVTLGMGAPMSFANYPYMARVTRDVGRASSVLVATERHDGEFQSQVAAAIEAQFKSVGIRVGSVFTIAAEMGEAVAMFDIIIILLLIMALLLAVVGGLGLMGTMSINVLERTREIGVIRAIGASDGAVVQGFIVEGVVIGVLSWLLAALLAYPLSSALSDAVAVALLQTTVTYVYSVEGMLLWLGVVTALSALASFLPAWNASRLTVREVLAYE